MDDGRRSFLQGNGIVSSVLTGYIDAMAQDRKPSMASANISNDYSSTYSQADSTKSLMYAHTTNTWAQPVYVGYWELVPKPNAFRIASTKRPIWLWRVMSKAFFGWTWHDGSLF